MTNEDQSNVSRVGDDIFGLAAVRELLQLIGQTDVSELLIERNNTRLHIKRYYVKPVPQQPPDPETHHALFYPTDSASTPYKPAGVPPPVARHPSSPASLDDDVSSHTLKSPMVGTFRASATPDDPPFVQAGDEIFAGDTVCIIDALNTLHEIETDIAGRVTRLLVADGQPVQYGQPLMMIDPSWQG